MLLLDRLIDIFDDKSWITGFDEDFLPLVQSGLRADPDHSDAGQLGEPLIVSTQEIEVEDVVFWGFTVIGMDSKTDYGTLWLPVDIELRGMTHLYALTTLLRLALNGREAVTEEECAAYELLLQLTDRDNEIIDRVQR